MRRGLMIAAALVLVAFVVAIDAVAAYRLGAYIGNDETSRMAFGVLGAVCVGIKALALVAVVHSASTRQWPAMWAGIAIAIVATTYSATGGLGYAGISRMASTDIRVERSQVVVEADERIAKAKANRALIAEARPASIVQAELANLPPRGNQAVIDKRRALGNELARSQEIVRAENAIEAAITVRRSLGPVATSVDPQVASIAALTGWTTAGVTLALIMLPMMAIEIISLLGGLMIAGMMTVAAVAPTPSAAVIRVRRDVVPQVSSLPPNPDGGERVKPPIKQAATNVVALDSNPMLRSISPVDRDALTAWLDANTAFIDGGFVPTGLIAAAFERDAGISLTTRQVGAVLGEAGLTAHRRQQQRGFVGLSYTGSYAGPFEQTRAMTA